MAPVMTKYKVLLLPSSDQRLPAAVGRTVQQAAESVVSAGQAELQLRVGVTLGLNRGPSRLVPAARCCCGMAREVPQGCLRVPGLAPNRQGSRGFHCTPDATLTAHDVDEAGELVGIWGAFDLI